jgi:hypothetical protein
MTLLQKIAWQRLAICALSVIVFGLIILLVGLSIAWSAFAILGLVGFLPFPRSQSESGRIQLDERDQAINNRAMLIALRVFWLFYVIASVSTWWIAVHVYHTNVVPVSVLPDSVFIAWLLFTIVQSVAILVQYKQGVYYE